MLGRAADGLDAQCGEALANLRLDQVKQNVSPITFVKRGRQVDLGAIQRRGPNTTILRTEKGEEELKLAPENLYARALRAFHAAMRGEGAPSATGEDGVWSLAAGVATLEAAKTGRVTKINPGL